MEYITLGKTNLRVSRLGFGGIPIQRINADEAKVLLDAVHKAGINYIDTARGYTVSEELIGQAIEGRRKDFILATKSMARDKEGMAKDIEISLKNLRTDYIDIYQVHNPSAEQLAQVCAEGGALEALREAKAAHDALEAVYNPYVDFDGVRALAALEAGRLLSWMNK